MLWVNIVLIFHLFAICSTKEFDNKVDRFIIPCHSTDYLCFKTQYHYLRDHVLLGTELYNIPVYQPYSVQYSNTSTCVRVSGVEESQLVGIRFDGSKKMFAMTFTTPVRLQQMEWRNESQPCQMPDRGFPPMGPHIGPLQKFSGNATVLVEFPYTLHTNNGDVYLKMEEDTLDVILDIPDSRQYDRLNETEAKLAELSDWAYNIVRRVDIPEHTIVPYITQLKRIYSRLPLERFILLYPTEDYTSLLFEYSDENIVQ